MADGNATYATVQIGHDEHVNLNSDLLYINHSCEPSLVSVMANMLCLFPGYQSGRVYKRPGPSYDLHVHPACRPSTPTYVLEPKMPTPPQFLVRDAGTVEGDDPFIISAFDAVLPFLDSIGSHEQWGSTPFSHREGWPEETLQQIGDSERYRLTRAADGDGDALRIFIVERQWPAGGAETLDAGQSRQTHSRVEVDGRRFLSVGFAFIRENWVPSCITSQCHLHIGDAERGSFVVST